MGISAPFLVNFGHEFMWPEIKKFESSHYLQKSQEKNHSKWDFLIKKTQNSYVNISKAGWEQSKKHDF